jgi:hypothetical protein
MDPLAGLNPSPPPDPAPLPGRPALDGATEDSRRRLAQLIGRLLARQWLHDRQGQKRDRHDPEELTQGGSP